MSSGTTASNLTRNTLMSLSNTYQSEDEDEDKDLVEDEDEEGEGRKILQRTLIYLQVHLHHHFVQLSTS